MFGWLNKKNESTKCSLKKTSIKTDNNYQQIFDLEIKLREALTNEDFSTAARLRDEIRKLKKED
ncbi:MAG: UvrB/UvrC motif-containing protein [Candidatus Omnitrophota bacterium]